MTSNEDALNAVEHVNIFTLRFVRVRNLPSACVRYHFDFGSTHDTFEPSLTPQGNFSGRRFFDCLLSEIQIRRAKYFQKFDPIFHCPTHATYQHGHVLVPPLCRRQLYPPLTYVGQPSPNFLSQHLRNPRRSRCLPALYQAFPLPPLVSTANMFCLSTFCRLWINHEGKERLDRIWRPFLN